MNPLRSALLLSLLAAGVLPSDPLAAQDRAVPVDSGALRRLGEGRALLRVGDGNTDTVAPAGGVQRIRRGEMLINITGRGPSRVRPSAEGTAAADGASLPLPSVGAGPDHADAGPLTYDLGYEIGVAGAEGGDGSDLRILTPVVEVENGGFRFDPEEGAYLGSILVGLIDHARPGEHGQLWDSVWVQISGGVQSVPPFTLRRFNAPFEKVVLRAEGPVGDSVRIRLRPHFDREGVLLAIPLHRARLVVIPSPLRIAGLGLEQTQLLVQAPEGRDSLTVALTSVRSNPQPNHLVVTSSSGVAGLRSSGTGWDTVTVLAGPYEGTAVVYYAWPVAFLLSALLGGLTGGLVNLLSSRRTSSRRTNIRLGAQGALTGLAAAVLYALGINVVGWAPASSSGEALMFAVAFLAGLGGPGIFDRILPVISAARAARKTRRKRGGDAGSAPPEPAPEPEPESTAVG
jgi:hypothetical protein